MTGERRLYDRNFRRPYAPFLTPESTVDRLVFILRSGALSAELRDKPVSENTIGPTLGEDTIHLMVV